MFLFRCVLEFRCGWIWVVSVLHAEACNTDTTPTQPHWNSNTRRTKNNTTNVVIQQNIRQLLMMDILMSETCWAHKKYNKIASDIKLVFNSSTITMMHGLLNISLSSLCMPTQYQGRYIDLYGSVCRLILIFNVTKHITARCHLTAKRCGAGANFP